MACRDPLLIQDPLGFLCALNTDDQGIEFITVLGPGTTPPVYVNDPANTTSWQLVIVIGIDRILTLTPVALATYPVSIPLISLSGQTFWNLTADTSGFWYITPTSTPAISIHQWNVTDQQVMSLLQLMTLEPDTAGATWLSGIWSTTEILSYLNDVQRDFLARTAINAAIEYLIGSPSQPRYNLSQDVLTVLRFAWREGAHGTAYIEVPRVDSWEMDYGNDDPASGPVPLVYMTDLEPSLTIQVSPAPGDIGEAEVTVLALGPTLDGSGIALSVPDDWTPYIAWGVLAKMLSKEGEGQDVDRATYCESRYQEGVALGRLAVEGIA